MGTVHYSFVASYVHEFFDVFACRVSCCIHKSDWFISPGLIAVTKTSMVGAAVAVQALKRVLVGVIAIEVQIVNVAGVVVAVVALTRLHALGEVSIKQ